MIGHIPIGKYHQHFSPHSPHHCPCGEADVETREHIFMQCKLYNTTWHPTDINITSFLDFITGNLTSFCFDNG